MLSPANLQERTPAASGAAEVAVCEIVNLRVLRPNVPVCGVIPVAVSVRALRLPVGWVELRILALLKDGDGVLDTGARDVYLDCLCNQRTIYLALRAPVRPGVYHAEADSMAPQHQPLEVRRPIEAHRSYRDAVRVYGPHRSSQPRAAAVLGPPAPQGLNGQC